MAESSGWVYVPTDAPDARIRLWYYDDQGKLRKTRTDLRRGQEVQAAERLAAMLRLVEQRKLASPTEKLHGAKLVGDVIPAFLEEERRRSSDGWHATVQGHVDNFIRPALAREPIAGVHPDLIFERLIRPMLDEQAEDPDVTRRARLSTWGAEERGALDALIRRAGSRITSRPAKGGAYGRVAAQVPCCKSLLFGLIAGERSTSEERARRLAAVLDLEAHQVPAGRQWTAEEGQLVRSRILNGAERGRGPGEYEAVAAAANLCVQTLYRLVRVHRTKLEHENAMRLAKVLDCDLAAIPHNPPWRGYAPGTVRHVAQTCKRLFDFMIRKRRHLAAEIDQNPCQFRRGELPQQIAKNPAFRFEEGAAFEEHEFRRFFDDLPWDQVVKVGLEGLAGMRHSDFAHQLWRDYQPCYRDQLGRIVVVRTKTGWAKEVPVHPLLAAILDYWRTVGWRDAYGRDPGELDYILPSVRDTRKPRSVDVENDIWERMLQDLGVPFRGGHSLRRTFITMGAEHGDIHTFLYFTHRPDPRNMGQTYDRPSWGRLCNQIMKLPVSVEWITPRLEADGVVLGPWASRAGQAEVERWARKTAAQEDRAAGVVTVQLTGLAKALQVYKALIKAGEEEMAEQTCRRILEKAGLSAKMGDVFAG